jgi:HK97 family phage major capsid protein
LRRDGGDEPRSVGHPLAGSALDRPAVWPANLEGSFMTVYSADFSAEEVAYLRSQVAAGDTSAKAILDRMRTPSMAGIIGSRPSDGVTPAIGAGHPYLKASLDSDLYAAGGLASALFLARSHDADEQRTGKAMLTGFGVAYADAPEGKATLGTTGATGGYVLPNNLVDQVVKPAVADALYTVGPDPLLTVRSGIMVRGIDLPYRLGKPTRAGFQNWGSAKENVDESYGSYTATLGTLAKIYDVGKQYLRFSAGSAEQDVMDELAKSFHLAENYAVIAGPGTGGVGTGDPTTGLYTALVAAAATFTTTFAGASASTVLGSAATAFTQGLGALASRAFRPTAIVMDSMTLWAILAQGSDTAGFWANPTGGPAGFSRLADGNLAYWGVPLLGDPNFNANTGTTKAAIAADWKAFKFFRGLEFRIDTSDQAGSRWDNNLVGFRGEEEVGFNASPGVSVGAAQLLKAIIP